MVFEACEKSKGGFDLRRVVTSMDTHHGVLTVFYRGSFESRPPVNSTGLVETDRVSNGSTELDSDDYASDNAGCLRKQLPKPDDYEDFVPVPERGIWYDPNQLVFCCGMRFTGKD